jgi:hypothetical protein
MDFTVIDAPFECPDEVPAFHKKFMDGQPGRMWIKAQGYLEDEEKVKWANTESYHGVDEMLGILCNTIQEQGPFDGVLGFSQGGIAWRHFCRITNEIDPEEFKNVK